jgi:hypothetical protein
MTLQFNACLKKKQTSGELISILWLAAGEHTFPAVVLR